MPTNPNESATGYGFAGKEVYSEERGLTKREHFAAMAMQGMLANPNGARTSGGSNTMVPEALASWAVNQADALIEELNKG